MHHTRTGGVSARTTMWEMVLILPRIWGRTTVLRRSPASQRIRYRVNADEKQSGLRVRDYFDEISGWNSYATRMAFSRATFKDCEFQRDTFLE